MDILTMCLGLVVFIGFSIISFGILPIVVFLVLMNIYDGVDRCVKKDKVYNVKTKECVTVIKDDVK